MKTLTRVPYIVNRISYAVSNNEETTGCARSICRDTIKATLLRSTRDIRNLPITYCALTLVLHVCQATSMESVFALAEKRIGDLKELNTVTLKGTVEDL